MTGPHFRIGCDIGGTFTDFIVFDELTGAMHLEKCLTTPGDPSQGVMEGLELLAGRIPELLGSTSQVLHGTTLVINAVMERKGARTALLTTQGFRDVIAIGTERRYDLYDLQQTYPEPLIPRELRQPVLERIRADGQVLTPLDLQGARQTVAGLEKEGIESVAICLLHSYLNPSHERDLRDMLASEFPAISVSISSEVLPEINEYMRTSTTIVNAYVKPLMQRYLGRLLSRLEQEGFGGQLLIMLSNGGVTSTLTASEFPVRVIESGPVGGVIMGQHVKRKASIANALAFDMGGTTAKVSLLEGNELMRASDYEVARVHRFKAGSGIPIRVPCVDILEIGAGGGSLASINMLNLLQIGPESSGAVPGPVCYGRGGRQPTITDADLVLGFLNPDHFLGGSMQLDLDAARNAITERIAKPLDLDTAMAAWGIHDAVNENMAAATKMYAAERGIDPANLSIIASGGAGPVHAYGLAKKLGAKEVVMPVAVGVASAVGFLLAPISYDVQRTYKVPVSRLDLAEMDEAFASMEAEATEVIRRAGETREPTVRRMLDVHYVGQGYEVSVHLPSGSIEALGIDALNALFSKAYDGVFERVFGDNEFEVVTLRLTAEGPSVGEVAWAPTRPQGSALKGTRRAFSHISEDFVDYQVFDRYAMPAGYRIEGPAIVEERESTTVIWEGGSAYVSAEGFLRISVD